MATIASDVLISRLSEWGVDTVFGLPGGFGVHVDKPGDLPGALREAFAHPGPALVDVAVDPNEPPLPGKIEYEQAKHFAQAFLRGQPHRASIATTLFKDRIQQLRGD
jgi:pyruvate dehydrogenase (quinone)